MLKKKLLVAALCAQIASIFLPAIFPLNSDYSWQNILETYLIFTVFFHGGILIYGLPVSIHVGTIVNRMHGLSKDIASFILHVGLSVPAMALFNIFPPIIAGIFSITESLILRIQIKGSEWAWSFAIFSITAILWGLLSCQVCG